MTGWVARAHWVGLTILMLGMITAGATGLLLGAFITGIAGHKYNALIGIGVGVALVVSLSGAVLYGWSNQNGARAPKGLSL